MLTSELFNNTTHEQKKDLGYDLKDDLMFFMNNDPDFYRKKYYPTMLKFDKYCKEGKSIRPHAFKSLVDEAYAVYKNKFPVEGLEKQLEQAMCEEICEAICEQETKNSKDGIYDGDD
jgi:hypothetical protein